MMTLQIEFKKDGQKWLFIYYGGREDMSITTGPDGVTLSTSGNIFDSRAKTAAGIYGHAKAFNLGNGTPVLNWVRACFESTRSYRASLGITAATDDAHRGLNEAIAHGWTTKRRKQA